MNSLRWEGGTLNDVSPMEMVRLRQQVENQRIPDFLTVWEIREYPETINRMCCVMIHIYDYVIELGKEKLWVR